MFGMFAGMFGESAAKTKIECIQEIIESFNLEDLGLNPADTQSVKDRLQQRLQKIPNMNLAPLLHSLSAPAPDVPSDVAVDEWTGWVTCIAEELPPQKGTDVYCDCGAVIGEKCKTADGSPTRYHRMRAGVNGNRNRDLERAAWTARARAGEVDFCKCSICYGYISSEAERRGIACEEMEQVMRANLG